MQTKVVLFESSLRVGVAVELLLNVAARLRILGDDRTSSVPLETYGIPGITLSSLPITIILCLPGVNLVDLVNPSRRSSSPLSEVLYISSLILIVLKFKS